jgi:hypothetical protein
MKLDYNLNVNKTVVDLTCKDYAKISKQLKDFDLTRIGRTSTYTLECETAKEAFSKAAEISQIFDDFDYVKPTKPVVYKNSNDAFSYEVTAGGVNVTLKILKMHKDLVAKQYAVTNFGSFGDYNVKSVASVEIATGSLFLCGYESSKHGDLYTGIATSTVVNPKEVAKKISESLNLFMASDIFKKYLPVTKFEHLTVYKHDGEECLYVNGNKFFNKDGFQKSLTLNPSKFKFVRKIKFEN